MTMAAIEFGKTPIYVLDRPNGGVLLMQGTSQLRVSAAEVDALIDALRPPARMQRYVAGVEQ
jgi:hypothetical protein